jgi:hypothetical protein
MAEAYSGMRDILLGFDTDLHFENGDLMVTTGIDYIQREIFKVLSTELGEWKLNQNLGGSPHIFVGQPNTREVGDALQKHIYNNIKETVFPAASTVRVIPISNEKLMVFIDIFIMDLKVAIIPFQFDFSGGLRRIQVYDPRVVPPVSSSDLKLDDIRNTQRPNQYWSRLRGQ